VPIEGVAQAATLLIGFGRDVEVLSPPELRAELGRRAADVVALYS
jgi:predicted DNA-binding transcriptional regulator YafY